MEVIDLGCTPGFFTTMLSEAVGDEAIVYAVDGDEAAVAKLKERVEMMGLTNIKSFISSAADMSFVPDRPIDFLFSNGLMCCMHNHRSAIDEISRVVKPGSVGFISVTKVLRNTYIGVSKNE